MPSSRTLLPGLFVVLAACASAKRPPPAPAATVPPRPAVSPTPAPPGAPTSPSPRTPPIVVSPPASPLPVAPSAPALAEPGALRPVLPAAPLPDPVVAPAAATSLPRPPPPPPVPTIAPSSPRMGPAATTANGPTAWPASLPEFLAELRRRARSGAEPAFAPVADLLDEVAAAAPMAGAEISITRLREFEAREQAAFGRGTGWCTLTTFVEPGADATAMRASYLDIDRVHEYTGKPGASLVRREGDVTIGRTDAIRRALAFEFGARWTFRARSLDRGAARLVVTSMEPAADTSHMLATRGLIVAFPTREGLFVAEVNASLVDFTVPPLLKSTAEGIARKEMLARVAGVRAHWREYVR